MDQENIGNLRDKLISIIKEKNVKNIVFNLKELTFMDSTGIGIIIGRYNLLNLINSKMVILNPSNSIKRVIELSSISRNITMRSE